MTIFSAANYCGEFDNDGAVMSVDETLMCSFRRIKPQLDKKGKFGATPSSGKKAGSAPYQKKFQAKFTR